MFPDVDKLLSNGSEYHTVVVDPSDPLLGEEPDAVLVATTLDADVKYVLLLFGEYGVCTGVTVVVVTVDDHALNELISSIAGQYVAALHLNDAPEFKPLNVTERVVLVSPLMLSESISGSGDAGSHPNPVSSSR